MIKNVRVILENEVDVRMAETVVMRMRNGSFYKLTKHSAKNGKVGDYIQWDEKHTENDATIEFLQNYLREGRLVKETKRKIQGHIRKLKSQKCLITKSSEIQEKINLHGVQSTKDKVNEGSEPIMYSNETKYIYRSNSYKIDDILDFVIKARIQNKSPFTLLNDLDYPSGTVHTWYKDSNELRILYSLYNMNLEQINEKLNEYDIEQIDNFNKDIRHDVLECQNISEELRKKYLEKIDKFTEYAIEKENKRMSLIKEDENNMLTAIKLITQTKEIWNVFAETNKEKIFEILYNDEEILSMILNKINFKNFN